MLPEVWGIEDSASKLLLSGAEKLQTHFKSSAWLAQDYTKHEDFLKSGYNHFWFVSMSCA